jgi:FdhE protein
VTGTRRPASETTVEAFERRAARADLLASGSETARAPLRFAAVLYRAQGALAAALGGRTLSGRLSDDIELFAANARQLLRAAAAKGPDSLAQAAKARAGEDGEALHARLRTAWEGNTDGAADYLSRAVLKPYLEVLAGLEIRPDRARPAGACPFCGGRPWICARRSAGDADGAQRLLVCALCAVEWQVNRIHCPVCGEQDPTKLPSFHTESHPGARIEACESCHRYVKSIDLTLDGRLIPEVDDLTSLSLDLWAADEGFSRLEPGLAGV